MNPLGRHLATPRELQARLAAERRGAPFLLLFDGEGRQQLAELAGERITIGRRSGNDVALGWDAQVSRVHATIERAGDDWLVADDGVSRNGTWLNGGRVVGRRRLRDGDVLRVGGTELVFRRPPAEDSQATATAGGATTPEALTPAQRRVLVALCRPYHDAEAASPATNREIAAELVVGVDAVKSTLRTLFTAFGVDELPQNAKRAALAQAALRRGLVSRRDL